MCPGFVALVCVTFGHDIRWRSRIYTESGYSEWRRWPPSPTWFERRGIQLIDAATDRPAGRARCLTADGTYHGFQLGRLAGTGQHHCGVVTAHAQRGFQGKSFAIHPMPH